MSIIIMVAAWTFLYSDQVQQVVLDGNPCRTVDLCGFISALLPRGGPMLLHIL